MKKYFTLLLFITSLPLFSQPPVEQLNNFFVAVRANSYPAIPQEVIKPAHASIILSVLSPYYKDTLAIVRSKAFAIARSVGSNSKEQSIRKQSVQQLINACRDTDSGIVGSALAYLTEFRKEDFSAVAKDSLRNLFNNRPAHFSKLIKLIGFVELNDLQPNLRDLARQTDIAKTDRWAAQLALARMGDKEVMLSIIERVKKLKVNDDLVYQVLPDLIYTRQPEAISYMVDILNSDAKNCEAADAEREASIPCAYRVMEQLAPALERYPLKLDESGDIDTKDYVAALKKVRGWVKLQKEYKIVKDTY